MDLKWHIRFLKLARHVSEWSRDPSTKCGAVIVRNDKTISSIGFNGFPRGMDDNKEFYEDRNIKLSRIVHAEMNALIHMPRDYRGTHFLYTYPSGCCDRCMVHMIQAGILDFVCPYPTPEFKNRWGASLYIGKEYAKEVGGTYLEIPMENL